MTNRYAHVPLVFAQMGIPKPVQEFRFDETRRWRLDFAWPEYKVALEIDGGIFVNGGHNRGAQIMKTWEKENTAACMGWRFIKCQPKDVLKLSTIETLKKALSWAQQDAPHQQQK